MKSSAMGWVVATAAILATLPAPCARGESSRATIDIPDALGAEFGSAPQRVVRLELFLDGGDVASVLVLPAARNPALAGWDARDVQAALVLKGGRIEGAIGANITAVGRGEAVPWKCVLDAMWKGGVLAGRVEPSAGGAALPMHKFSVAPAKLASMKGGDGFLELWLPGGGGDASVRAGIVFREGKAVAAASFSPLIHPVWRRLDASALALKKGRLSGTLAWPATQADDDVPAAAAGELKLNLDLRDGFAPAGVKERGGAAMLSPARAFPANAEVELALDAPLIGGERWRRRAVARIELSQQRAAVSAFLNGRADPGWSGVGEALSIEGGPGRFAGAFEATVASATVQPGVYEIRFNGEIVGPWIVGTFESVLAGDETARGDFTGWYAPAGP